MRNATPYQGPHRLGAPMGRPNLTPVPGPEAVKVSLRRIRLNSGGYDPGGVYWGHGGAGPLWYACSEDGPLFEVFFRARDRDRAKARVLDLKPGARFFR